MAKRVPRRSPTPTGEAPPPAAKSAIIVHGGAGVHDPARLPRCRQGCEAAARSGWAALERGGTALDAVEAAVQVLEEDGEFNAGHGAMLNREGVIEVDAALMETGPSNQRPLLRAGGVGAVPWLRHPIVLARRVLEEGLHVLLVGDGALAFGRDHQIFPDPPERLITPRARERYLRERTGRYPSSATGDTVGAVAVDRSGYLAAGSSTGGISNKRPGRVGDSPIPGAGLYVRLDATPSLRAAAATATGHGESILRSLMSKVAVDALVAGADADAAARAAIDEMAARTGGTAGIILVDHLGRIAHHRNTPYMPWAAVVDGELDGGD